VKVEIIEPEGTRFDPGECDTIFVNAGMTHPLPMWLDRLRDGGRMVLPLTTPSEAGRGRGVMMKISRSGDRFAAEPIGGVGIFSAIGLRDATLEEPIKAAVQGNKLTGARSVRRGAHEPADTCILHAEGACLSSAEIHGASDSKSQDAQ